jgi:hypothetical protein
VSIHPKLPSFNALNDWATARGGYVTLEAVDHVYAPTSGELIDQRWNLTAFEGDGELLEQACSEVIEHAAEYICSELGIEAAAA